MNGKRWRGGTVGLGAALLAAGIAHADTAPLRVLCTTFPVYHIARQVSRDHAGVRLERMLPASLGCPHDYVLTPQDVQKIVRADVLVVNGLGLEAFLGAPVRRANPDIRLVDSSQGVTDTILNRTAHAHKDGWWHRRHRHEPSANPHLFASPRQVAVLATNIAAGLAAADPAGAPLYERNAREYAATMNALADDMAAFGAKLDNNRIVVQHGVFDYLARDMGLEIVATIQAHAGQDPSASETLRLIETAKRKRAGAVFGEPQYPERLARAIAREAGIPYAVLDPVASGPDDADIDYYEKSMRQNMVTLEAVLGTGGSRQGSASESD